jgi:hypothetical protein
MPLKDTEVREIRRQHEGGTSQGALAERFSVTTQTIGRVLRGEIGKRASKRASLLARGEAHPVNRYPEGYLQAAATEYVLAHLDGFPGEPHRLAPMVTTPMRFTGGQWVAQAPGTREWTLSERVAHTIRYRQGNEGTWEHAPADQLSYNGQRITEDEAVSALTLEQWKAQTDF